MRLKFSISVIDKCIEDFPLETEKADNLIRGDTSVDDDMAKV
jgi:hypothetical protein